MNLPVTGKINSAGHLEIGGCDTAQLAREFGTPLYVLDEEDIRKQCLVYKVAFSKRYPNSEIIYASKALSVTGLLKMLASEGIGLDVVSGGELFTAIKALFPSKKIYFHGNNKSKKEIEEGLAASVGRFVIDNFDEIHLIDEVTRDTGNIASVMVRVNPGVEAHTHDAVKTGQIDSKFGIAKEKVPEAVKMISGMKNLKFVGLHAHIGSQIFDAAGYLSEIDVLLELAAKLGGVEEINIGGGVGIAYASSDDPISIDDFAEAITKRFKEKIAELKIPQPKLIVEPGRSLVARAGVTLYTVGTVKEIPGLRKYIVVDGGMSDDPRPMLYGSRYQFVDASNMNNKANEKVTVAGRFCESGDILAKDIEMPKMTKGSLMAVLCTGAYNYSMASNYNRVPRPAMVMVGHGIAKLLVKRETYKDITNCDVI